MRRYALALWFAGLALLGFLRGYAAVSRHGVADTSARLWLGGAGVMLLVAVIAALGARRRD